MPIPLPMHPILVVSYVDETRTVLAASINSSGAVASLCATFCEAENLALKGLYSGLLVDLASMIKSKGEEKIVAYTLANYFPTLRVRTMGSLLVPIAIPGSVKQDSSLVDFLSRTCSRFIPRRLRAYRRHLICISTLLSCKGEEHRGFTIDLSWGGAFIADVFPERFICESTASVLFLGHEVTLDVNIKEIKPWGERFAPGISISFSELDESGTSLLSGILKTKKELDRDRLTP
jgi:hypothetical protein